MGKYLNKMSHGFLTKVVIKKTLEKRFKNFKKPLTNRRSSSKKYKLLKFDLSFIITLILTLSLTILMLMFLFS